MDEEMHSRAVGLEEKEVANAPANQQLAPRLAGFHMPASSIFVQPRRAGSEAPTLARLLFRKLKFQFKLDSIGSRSPFLETFGVEGIPAVGCRAFAGCVRVPALTKWVSRRG
jgi:hypothetical protein